MLICNSMLVLLTQSASEKSSNKYYILTLLIHALFIIHCEAEKRNHFSFMNKSFYMQCNLTQIHRLQLILSLMYVKTQQFLSSTRRDAHRRKLVPFFLPHHVLSLNITNIHDVPETHFNDKDTAGPNVQAENNTCLAVYSAVQITVREMWKLQW